MPRYRTTITGLVAILALGVVGCSTDDPEPRVANVPNSEETDSGGTDSENDDGQAHQAGREPLPPDEWNAERAKCLREEGIELVDGRAPDTAMLTDDAEQRAAEGKRMRRLLSDPEFRAAARRCEDRLPPLATEQDDYQPSPKELRKQRAYAKCIREHGVESFPDPDPDDVERQDQQRQDAIDSVSEDTWYQAMDACEHIFNPDYQPGDVYDEKG